MQTQLRNLAGYMKSSLAELLLFIVNFGKANTKEYVHFVYNNILKILNSCKL